jgi:hypothetical protein
LSEIPAQATLHFAWTTRNMFIYWIESRPNDSWMPPCRSPELKQ